MLYVGERDVGSFINGSFLVANLACYLKIKSSKSCSGASTLPRNLPSTSWPATYTYSTRSSKYLA